MDQQAYLRAVDACLERVARALDRDEDLDVITSDGLVTVEFEDGTRYVLNRQSGASQMWLAAGARAWHYDWDAGRQAWLDDRDGHDLYHRLGEVVGTKLGRPVPV
jgi:iron-sulfur cluster assembly protein CyaY